MPSCSCTHRYYLIHLSQGSRDQTTKWRRMQPYRQGYAESPCPAFLLSHNTLPATHFAPSSCCCGTLSDTHGLAGGSQLVRSQLADGVLPQPSYLTAAALMEDTCKVCLLQSLTEEGNENTRTLFAWKPHAGGTREAVDSELLHF